MIRTTSSPARTFRRCAAPVGFALLLALGAAACGSEAKTDTGNTPATVPAGGATSAPQSGGAGF